MKDHGSTFYLTPKQPFDFIQTVTAHGWVGLQPNHWDMKNNQMERIQQLSDGRVVKLLISSSGPSPAAPVSIEVPDGEELTSGNKKEIREIAAHMLRLDEDFSGLYALAAKKGAHFSGITGGFGRLLRSPTVFEDIVKTICTTNIQWGGTKRMVNELIRFFGKQHSDCEDKKSFPTAEKIAEQGFQTFTEKTSLGYRSSYVYGLSEQVAGGKLDLQSFLDPGISTSDLKKKLLSIKGIGNYAAATMLMLLGHYDALPVDSVFREFVFKRYFNGKAVSGKRAEKIYNGWGKWKYLAYWYDMTRDN